LRVRSWEEFGLDPKKVLLSLLLLVVAVFAAVLLLGLALRIGTISPVLGAIAAGGACYFVAAAPKRRMKVSAFLQTSEAPLLAAASNIYLNSMGSRSKTLLMIRAEEPVLRAVLSAARRRTLLGYDAISALRVAGSEDKVQSESAKTALAAVVGMDGARVEEGSDELDGMLSASELDHETKLPLLMAISFFLPIMLMLFAAMTKETGPSAMAALLVLEVIILDITMAIATDPLQSAGRDAP